jgi:hypothetical protein
MSKLLVGQTVYRLNLLGCRAVFNPLPPTITPVVITEVTSHYLSYKSEHRVFPAKLSRGSFEARLPDFEKSILIGDTEGLFATEAQASKAAAYYLKRAAKNSEKRTAALRKYLKEFEK